jgi:hypothetical protein
MNIVFLYGFVILVFFFLLLLRIFVVLVFLVTFLMFIEKYIFQHGTLRPYLCHPRSCDFGTSLNAQHLQLRAVLCNFCERNVADVGTVIEVNVLELAALAGENLHCAARDRVDALQTNVFQAW